MSWKLDNIDFEDYGVFVSRSAGVLDMPRIKTSPENWLDENGIDYWQAVEDIKYDDRDIIISCWLFAAGYEAFKAAVASFYTALTGEGKRQLFTPFGNTIEVYLEDQIKMVRKTSYVSSLQRGLFTLKLTAPGDPDFLQVDIKRWTGTENITVATVFTNNLRVNKTLQGEIYASCSFESNLKLDLKYFDFIAVNSNGVNNDIFHLGTDPEFIKSSSNKYLYNCRFEHQSSWLANSQFHDDRGQADQPYYANMEEIVDRIIINYNRSWWDNFSKGTVVATERRLHSFNAEDCMSVLKRLSAEYNVEFEFQYISASKYAINIKEKVANDKEIILEYGKGKGLYELSREQIEKGELVTILYAYGAAKNLKPDYRGGLTRLSFENNPLKNNEDLYTGAGPIERTIFFDDIFPNRTAQVTSYEQKLPAAMTEAEKQVNPEGVFKVIDTTLDFDLNDYLLGGLTAKIRMKTGDLAGHEFDIARYDHSTKTIFLIPFKDERGEMFPGEVLTIKAGDYYTLVDIDQPVPYVAVAEAELEAAAQAYLTNHSTYHFPYRVKVDPAFIKLNPTGFEVGDRINIIDADYGINGLYRISTLTYDLYKKSYEFVLADTARISKREETEMRLQAVERALASTRFNETETTEKAVEPTNELRNRILDPIDDKINVDRNIRNESIDPRMLSYDSGTLQWSIKPAWFEGFGTMVRWTDGEFLIHNFADRTLDRFGIDNARIAGTYDPTRSWIIPAGNFIVEDFDV